MVYDVESSFRYCFIFLHLSYIKKGFFATELFSIELLLNCFVKKLIKNGNNKVESMIS